MSDLEFLSQVKVQALLTTHPNSCDEQLVSDSHWPHLVQFYMSGESEQPIPTELSQIIHQIRLLQLPRIPIPIPDLIKLPSEVGMSPKKVHEVARMTTYIVRLIEKNNLPIDHLRIVDVGAGQGYLTRSLKFHFPQLHILALDADEGQTTGAKRWERRLLPDTHPKIVHKTVLITPQNLLTLVDEWVSETLGEFQKHTAPVLFVALHACGSLTPDILRAYVGSKYQPKVLWTSVGVVAVGCCYNLMFPNDFPLSQAYSTCNPPLRLPTSAFHLAAQIPSEWLRSVSPLEPESSVALAVRKVVYRALLTKVLPKATSTKPPVADKDVPCNSATVLTPWMRRPETWEPRSFHENSAPISMSALEIGSSTSGMGQTPDLIRLGKLNDRCYASWSAFLRAVEHKLSVRFPEEVFHEETKGIENTNANGTLERRLEVLHTMRCLLGPVIESAILRDRVRWTQEALTLATDLEKVQIGLVNLFDQSTGSGRNVAIVIAPRLALV